MYQINPLDGIILPSLPKWTPESEKSAIPVIQGSQTAKSIWFKAEGRRIRLWRCEIDNMESLEKSRQKR